MWTLIAVLLKANYRGFFSFEVDCSKTFLTRPKLAQYVKRRSALSSVDDLFIGISKSGNHAFVFSQIHLHLLLHFQVVNHKTCSHIL